MKVLAVMPGLTHDAGAERTFLALAPQLLERGHEVHLVLFTDRQEPVPALVAQGMVFHDLSDRRSTWARARALRTLIAEIRPDVINSSLHEASMPAQLAVIGRREPLVATWTGMAYSDAYYDRLGRDAWKLRLIQYAETLTARLAGTRFHAVTEGVARHNAERLRVAADRIQVGERGRDAAQFATTPERVAALADELGIDVGDPVVLAVGRQDAIKGYDELLAAFDELAADRPRARLLIAGRPGPATPGLEEQRRTMAHGDRVAFLGQRPDVPELLGLASVVVCSSHSEGAAGALLEAMAVGTPVVSVRLDGLAGVLVDGANAVVVDRPDLARGIASVLDDADLAARLSAAGRRTFEERFTLERSLDRLIEILTAVTSP